MAERDVDSAEVLAEGLDAVGLSDELDCLRVLSSVIRLEELEDGAERVNDDNCAPAACELDRDIVAIGVGLVIALFMDALDADTTSASSSCKSLCCSFEAGTVAEPVDRASHLSATNL